MSECMYDLLPQYLFVCRRVVSLNESRLERSGVSLGFQYTLMDIIEELVYVIVILLYTFLKNEWLCQTIQSISAQYHFCVQKSSDQGRDSEGLPPQPESPSNTVTSSLSLLLDNKIRRN